MQVAITFDDLPLHGPLLPQQSPTGVLRDLTLTLRDHGVSEAYGFVNACHAQSEQGLDALRVWLDAGHPLGNHTYSHADARTASFAEFVRDIERNEPVLRELSLGRGKEERWKTFRYPYLEEGNEPERQRIHDYLVQHGYRTSRVTIDFADWAYNAPYVRCMASHDAAGIAALEQSYLASALSMLRWTDRARTLMAQGPVKHVLLLHCGVFTTVMLDRLLSAYEEAGATWVTLEEVFADEDAPGGQAVSALPTGPLFTDLLPLSLLDAIGR